MNRVKLTIVAFLLTSFVYAEQSVYSDEDFVDSATVAKKNGLEIFKLKQKISQLKERIEGLKSLVNGQADEIAALKQRNNDTLEKIVNQLSQRVEKLESRPAQIVKVKEVTTKIADVTSSTPKQDVAEENTSSTKVAAVKKPAPKPVSNKELYKESVLNFTKNRLTKAKEGFKTLLKKDYKKASVSFYLGEISYKKARYKDAIDYYQKSATLNDNASYMSKLLLHTAVSLTKKGKSQDAKIFFKAVSDGYPDTKEAKEAKKYLK